MLSPTTPRDPASPGRLAKKRTSHRLSCPAVPAGRRAEEPGDAERTGGREEAPPPPPGEAARAPTHAELLAGAAREVALAERRRGAFGGEAELQLALRAAQDLCGKLLAASGTPAAAWRRLTRFRRRAEKHPRCAVDDLEPEEFEAAVALDPLYVPGPQARRCLALLELAGGVSPLRAEDFAAAARLVAPAASLLDLRLRLVQRYGSVPVALETLRAILDPGAAIASAASPLGLLARPPGDLEVAGPDLQGLLASAAGVPAGAARRIARGLDPRRRGGGLLWRELERGLAQAPAYLLLEALRDALLHDGHGSLEQGVAARLAKGAAEAACPDAEKSVDCNLLRQLGIPNSGVEQVCVL